MKPARPIASDDEPSGVPDARGRTSARARTRRGRPSAVRRRRRRRRPAPARTCSVTPAGRRSSNSVRCRASRTRPTEHQPEQRALDERREHQSLAGRRGLGLGLVQHHVDEVAGGRGRRAAGPRRSAPRPASAAITLTTVPIGMPSAAPARRCPPVVNTTSPDVDPAERRRRRRCSSTVRQLSSGALAVQLAGVAHGGRRAARCVVVGRRRGRRRVVVVVGSAPPPDGIRAAAPPPPTRGRAVIVVVVVDRRGLGRHDLDRRR